MVSLTLRCVADGPTGFVANIEAGTVSVVNLALMKVVKRSEIDSKPTANGEVHEADGMARVTMGIW